MSDITTLTVHSNDTISGKLTLAKTTRVSESKDGATKEFNLTLDFDGVSVATLADRATDGIVIKWQASARKDWETTRKLPGNLTLRVVDILAKAERTTKAPSFEDVMKMASEGKLTKEQIAGLISTLQASLKNG